MESSHHPHSCCIAQTRWKIFEGYFLRGLLDTCHVKSRAVGSHSSPALSSVLQWAAQPLGVSACTLIFQCMILKKHTLCWVSSHMPVFLSVGPKHSSTGFLLLLLQSVTLDMTELHTGLHCVLHSLILIQASVCVLTQCLTSGGKETILKIWGV